MNTSGSHEREYRLDKAIAEYLRMKASDAAPDRDTWLAMYPDIRQELEEFLDDLELLGNEHPADDFKATEVHHRRLSSISEGKVIANKYVLEQSLGAGGMGEVWVARQTQPIRRRVALKFIRVGLDSRVAQARFEAERQALAIMDHPNIARVYDGGLTDEGNPFIVMELINGVPLCKFCDDANLDVKQRISLFANVCQGVQHAHQKGIIHRDLKPSNILVTMYDGLPVAKIIDFGVAKATGGKLAEESFLTSFGSVVGTLEYMAPEQAGPSGQDIDTRADIYSLGVVLYELLTGLRPIDAERLRSVALIEMLRLIQEEEPLRPSTRISSHHALVAHAARRHVEPRKLMAMLRGELDWIVMKCLEKNRNRRYASANGLAVDLQRFLAGEAIEARPPTNAYRLSKLLRRHKTFASVTAALILTMLFGLISTSMAMQHARIAAAEAVRQRDLAVAIKEFLTNDLLGQASPELNPRAENVTVEQLLDRASAELLRKDTLEADPIAKAEIFALISATYQQLGNYQKAFTFWNHTLAANETIGDAGHPNRILDAKQGLASAYADLSRYEDAEKLLREVVAVRRQMEDPNNDSLLFAENDLALAIAHQGRFAEAKTWLKEVLDLRSKSVGETNASTLQAVANYAGLHMATGDYEQADQLYRRAIDGFTAIDKLDSPDAMACENGFISNLIHQRKYSDAKLRLRQLIVRKSHVLGDRHSETLGTRTNLAYVLGELGEFDAALTEALESYTLLKQEYGESFHETLTAQNTLVLSLRNAKQFDKAIEQANRLIEITRADPQGDARGLIVFINNLGWILEGKGDFAAAESAYLGSLNEANRTGLTDIPEAIDARHSLSRVYYILGKYQEAFDSANISLEARRRILPPNHPNTLATLRLIIDSLIKLERGKEALELIDATLRDADSLADPSRADLLFRLGRCQLIFNEYTKAIPPLESAIALRESAGAPKWTVGQARSELGEVLTKLDRYQDALSQLDQASQVLLDPSNDTPFLQEIIRSNDARINELKRRLKENEGSQGEEI
jgi:non-specific serine/threonine protein kinase/serine/threonine-protein kinase